MAYDSSFLREKYAKDEDELDPRSQIQAQAPGIATALSTPGTFVGSAPGTPGKFINFERYLAANDPAKMAGNVTEDFTKGGRDLESKIGGLQKDFRTQADKGTPTYGNEVVAPVMTTKPVQGQTKPITSTLQSSTQGLTGTPQKGEAAAYSPEGQKRISIEDAKQKAAQMKYTGPGSLMDVQGYGDVQKSLQDYKSKLGALKTPEGLQALLKEKYGASPGGYSEGQSRFDAALMGAGGGSRMADLQRQFGGLEKYLGDTTKSSGEYAQTMGADAAKLQNMYGAMAQDREREQAAQTALEAQQDAAKVGQTKPGPKRAYSDYTGYGHEDYVRELGRLGTYLNPVEAIMNAAGQRSVYDQATDAIEQGDYGKMAGKVWGRPNVSNEVRWFKQNDPMRERVYNSLTDEELAALEGMNAGDQDKWLNNKLTELLTQDLTQSK